jgi:DNA-directed RNA polymerase specialized sigma24 family protein
MDDATLVSRAVGGDRDAFAAVYDRDAGAVLDLCTAVLRDAEDAADVTLATFLRAARELGHLRDRSRLRLWLLAVARHEASAGARRPAVAPSVAAGAGVAAGPGANGSAGAGEAGESDGRGTTADDASPPSVWDPSASLSDSDRAILHLHLRHQLDAEELGAVVGVHPAVARARAARLQARAETSVGSLLLCRADTGADAFSCPGLTEVLEGWDGRFTPAIGARVARHARRCAACGGRRTMLLDRLRAMAALPFLPPPPWLRREVLLRMELAVSPRTLPGWQDDGFPPAIGGPPRRRGRAAARLALVAAALAVVGGGAFLLLRDDGGSRSTVTAAGSRTSPATTARPATGVTARTTPTSPSSPTSSTASSSPAASSPTVTTPPVAASLVPAVQAPLDVPIPPPVVADREPPAIAFAADAGSAYTYGCPYSVTGVSADVSDASPVTWVTLFVLGPDGVEQSSVMVPDGSVGGRWRATMGDFGTAGQAVFWVEAIDSEGNQSRTGSQVLDVFACQ